MRGLLLRQSAAGISAGDFDGSLRQGMKSLEAFIFGHGSEGGRSPEQQRSEVDEVSAPDEPGMSAGRFHVSELHAQGL